MPDEFVPVFTTQGTRLNSAPPWQTYADSLDIKADPALQSEIDEYSKHRHPKTGSETEEALCQQKEWSNQVAKQYAWLDPNEYIDEEARIGRIMSHAEFITKLRSVGLQCWYVEHPHPDKVTLLVNPRPGLGLEVGCWVPYGLMSELSVSRFDEHGVFVDEKYRGWRTCLMNLLLRGYISEDKINKVFPEPKYIQSFHRYNNFMYSMRNRNA